jgi:hypothetical protein
MVLFQHSNLISLENQALIKGLGNDQQVDFRNPIMMPLSHMSYNVSNIGIRQDAYCIYLHMKTPTYVPNYDAAKDELALYIPKCYKDHPLFK